MEIVIGSGDYIVIGAGNDISEGIQIRLSPNHGREIDSNADDIVNEAEVLCTILFKSLKAARLFQDQVNTACLRMNGYKVENA